MKNTKSGFTLIELLVVISIIGVLATIVLAATSSARNKARDTRVIGDIQQMRVSLHFGFNNPVFSDLYFANSGAVTSDALGSLTTAGPSHANLISLQTDLTNLTSTYIYRVNTNATAGNATTPNAIAFAVYGRLISDTSRYFCMDSSGRTNISTSVTTTAVCP